MRSMQVSITRPSNSMSSSLDIFLSMPKSLRTPEAALELLGAPQVSGDGDGAGDVPLSPDDAEPK
jgi:hypothetical protein